MNKAFSKDLIIREWIWGDDYSKLDFTEKDGTDPLGVNSFFHTNKAATFRQNKLASIWCVVYDKKLVGCFTLSMSAMNASKLSEMELVDKKYVSIKSYPAVLLGQLGIDKAYRDNGIGSEICKFCTGLAAVISNKISCRYIVLQTSRDKTKLYEKLDFVKSSKLSHGKETIWMYKKLNEES